MSELGRGAKPGVEQNVKVRIAGRAARQKSRVSRAQLVTLGVSDQRVGKWARTGYLFRELPGVYAVGSPARSEESDLFAAILYAGPGAALRALTAAVWRGLVKWRTAGAIQLATPRRCRALSADDPTNGLGRAIEVKPKQTFTRWPYHGLPTVPPAQIALDIAATNDLLLTRIVLANMDYRHILKEREMRLLCGRGVPGSAVLHQALRTPQPRLARARSPFEIDFIVVCEITNTPMPETNQYIEGIEVDAVWWDEMLVVQCDGHDNHDSPRQRARDTANDLRLRKLRFEVIRYRYEQLDDPWAIHTDLMAALTERRGWAARHGYAA